MPPVLPSTPNSSSLFLLLSLFLPILLPSPSAAALCNTSRVDLIKAAFQSVKGFNESLLRSTAFANCSADGAVELRLARRGLNGTVPLAALGNITGLRVLDLSGNALEGSVPPQFFASAASLLHLDLSSNKIGGRLRLIGNGPAAAAGSPLLSLNLSSNRFTNQPVLTGFGKLRELDLSRNNLSFVPEGIEGMKALEYLNLSWCNISQAGSRRFSGLAALKRLDLSGNGMNGSFPDDLPPLKQLQFLNLSRNSFSGAASAEEVHRFGRSAFFGSGVRTDDTRLVDPAHGGGVLGSNKNETSNGVSMVSQETHHRVTRKVRTTGKTKKKRRQKALTLGLAIGGAALLLACAAIASAACCLYRRKKREKKRKQWTITIPGTWKATRRGGGHRHQYSSAPLSLDPEAAWVAEASASAPSAPLVMFEKPLMELTFSDMVAATSGFGRESQLAEGRATGPVYRAVLPGDMDVVIKVLVRAREMEEHQAKAAVLELAGLKHPNLLPLLGYCVAGREKLLLYQYMENGDLHRWLHELPLAAPAPSSSRVVDDWAAGPDGGAGLQGRVSSGSAWAARYRIALGVARGLAFLHHAASGTPVVHGSVETSNVLLDESLEPRLSGLWPRRSAASGGGGGAGQAASVAGDVYGYGMVLLELLTGRVGSRGEVDKVRGMFKSGNGPGALDPRVLDGSEAEEAEEKEMVEALRVVYLCTADPAEKRPSMRQVVGLLKDIRPLAV